MKATFAGMLVAAAIVVASVAADAKPSSPFRRHDVPAVVENDFEEPSEREREPEAGIAPGHDASHDHTEGTVYVAWSSPSGPRVAELDVKTGAHLREVRFAWSKDDTWLRVVRRGEQLYVIAGRAYQDDAIHLARLAVADLAVQSDAVIGHGVMPEIVADAAPAHAVVAGWPESLDQVSGVRLVVVDGAPVTRRFVGTNSHTRLAAAGDHVDLLFGREIVRMSSATLATIGSFPIKTRDGYPIESRIGAHGDDFIFSTGDGTIVLPAHGGSVEMIDAAEDFALAENPATGHLFTSHGQLYDASWHLLAQGEPIAGARGIVFVSGRAVGLYTSLVLHRLDLAVLSTKP